MNPFVLDASTTMAWVLPGEATVQTKALLQNLRTTHAITPGLWQFEIANTLCIAQRKGRLTQLEAFDFLLSLGQFDIRPHEIQTADVLALSFKTNLTAHDASYLLLALQNHCPLATLDQKLGRAAIGLDVQVFGT